MDLIILIFIRSWPTSYASGGQLLLIILNHQAALVTRVTQAWGCLLFSMQEWVLAGPNPGPWSSAEGWCWALSSSGWLLSSGAHLCAEKHNKCWLLAGVFGGCYDTNKKKLIANLFPHSKKGKNTWGQFPLKKKGRKACSTPIWLTCAVNHCQVYEPLL